MRLSLCCCLPCGPGWLASPPRPRPFRFVAVLRRAVGHVARRLAAAAGAVVVRPAVVAAVSVVAGAAVVAAVVVLRASPAVVVIPLLANYLAVRNLDPEFLYDGRRCQSSYKMGHQSGLNIGGSDSVL